MVRLLYLTDMKSQYALGCLFQLYKDCPSPSTGNKSVANGKNTLTEPENEPTRPGE